MNLSESFKVWSDILVDSASALFSKIAALLPNLTGAFILLLLGWLAARILRGLCRRFFRWTWFEKAMETTRVNEFFKTTGIKSGMGELLGVIIYWVVFLVFMVAASEVLGLSVVLETLNRIILYIPNIVAAIAVVILSLFIARFVKDVITKGFEQVNMLYSRVFARVVEVLVIIFGLTVAMTQLGFNIGILMANITIFIGGFVAMVALSLGLGARTVVENLIAGYYVRQLLKPGQEAVLSGRTGKIKTIHSLGVVMETDEGEIQVPNHKIIKNGSFFVE